MENLSLDTHWKVVYDAAPAVRLALLGSQAKVGMAGHLAVSGDGSGRRFPFITAAVFDTRQPLEQLAKSMLWLWRPWAQLQEASHTARHTADFGDVQPTLAQQRVTLDDLSTADARWAEAEQHSLGDVEQQLRHSGHDINLRQSILALGLLLRPLLNAGAGRLEKSLQLPLPHGDGALVTGSLWLTLLAPFLARVDFEVLLMWPDVDRQPMLFLGFNGASPHALQAALSPVAGVGNAVSLVASQWVEAHVENEAGLRKLSTYLHEPDLSLGLAAATFREVFFGR
jgi:type VI secretion system protein ImpM